MKLFTKEQYERLLENGAPENTDKDKFPVVKIYLPDSKYTWILTEIHPDFPNIAYGLCDFGMGFPELGYIDLNEIIDLQNYFRYAVETEDLTQSFFPLSVYTKAAYANREIITNPNWLALFQIRAK